MAAREPFDTLTLYTLDPRTPVALVLGDNDPFAAVRHAGCAVRALSTDGPLRAMMRGTDAGWVVRSPKPGACCRTCGDLLVEVPCASV